MATDEQYRWLVTVLGVVLPEGTATAQPTEAVMKASRFGAKPAEIWIAAKQATDERLNQLASALRAFDIPQFRAIADLGLFAVTKGETVALTKALIEHRAAPAAAVGKVRAAVAAYRAVLAGNPKLALIDDNPFGIVTGIGPMLGRAFDEIEGAL